MSLKELLDTAKNNLQELTTVKNPDFRLEQAEFNKEEKTWEIVVSYLVENANKRSLPYSVLTSDFEFDRVYKKIKVNEKKEVIGFYIFNNK